MLNIKSDTNQYNFKIVDLHFAKSEEFLLTWSVDRISEIQLQVGETYSYLFNFRRVIC